MNTTFTIKEKTGYIYGYGFVHLPSTQTSTYNSDSIVLEAKAVVAEANSNMRDPHKEYLDPIALPEISDDCTYKEFRELFAQLPNDVQKQAISTYRIFKENPFHPSLHFKCINKAKSWYSVRINKSYRAIGTW